MNNTKRRTMWFPDALWAKVVAAAKRDGRTASGWIRQAILAALAR